MAYYVVEVLLKFQVFKLQLRNFMKAKLKDYQKKIKKICMTDAFYPLYS